MEVVSYEQKIVDSVLNDPSSSLKRKELARKWFMKSVQFKKKYLKIQDMVFYGEHHLMHSIPPAVYSKIFVEDEKYTWNMCTDDVQQVTDKLNKFTTPDITCTINDYLYEYQYPATHIDMNGLCEVLETFENLWVPIPIFYSAGSIGHSVFICINLGRKEWVFVDNLGNDYALNSGVSFQVCTMMQKFNLFSGYGIKLHIPFVEALQTGPNYAPQGTCLAWTTMIMRAICIKEKNPYVVYDELSAFSENERAEMIVDFVDFACGTTES